MPEIKARVSLQSTEIVFDSDIKPKNRDEFDDMVRDYLKEYPGEIINELFIE